MLSMLLFFFTLLAFDAVLVARAGIYIVNPQQGSTCHGGQPCTLQWLDDGQSPLLPAVGLCTVGLFTGNQQLVQTIEPVDVSTTHSLTFTPIPEAGPNSNTYYVSFISTTAKQNNSLPYAAFSPFFRLDKMTGSFSSPNPSATSSIPVPSPSPSSGGPKTGSGDVSVTITIGTISTSTAATPSSSASSPAASTSSLSTGAVISIPSAFATPISPTPSGFVTLVSSSSLVPSQPLLPSVSPSTLIVPNSVSSSSSTLAPSQATSTSANTNGAVGVSRGAGLGAALVAVGLVLVL